MIKFFQKLKAKKGFTLVELIVVIAIIGVLAAILIPTMLGYVTSSRVTSANSTAASLKNTIDNFLTDADTEGFGMKQSPSAIAEVVFLVDDTGKVSATVQAATIIKGGDTGTTGLKAFKNEKVWAKAKGEATATTKKTDCIGDGAALLAYQVKSLFPSMTNASAVVYLQGGKALYCAYTADVSTALTNADVPQVKDFEKGSTAWNGSTAGISKTNGYTLGTAPALSLAKS